MKICNWRSDTFWKMEQPFFSFLDSQPASQPASKAIRFLRFPVIHDFVVFLCLRLLRRVLLCTSLFPIKYHFAVPEKRTRTSPKQFDTRKNKKGGGREEEGENLIIDTWKVREQSERKNDKWLLLRKSSELVVEVVWGREVLKRVKFITSVFCSYVIKISTWEDAMLDAFAAAAAVQLLWRQFFVSKFFALFFDSFVPFERENEAAAAAVSNRGTIVIILALFWIDFCCIQSFFEWCTEHWWIAFKLIFLVLICLMGMMMKMRW